MANWFGDPEPVGRAMVLEPGFIGCSFGSRARNSRRAFVTILVGGLCFAPALAASGDRSFGSRIRLVAGLPAPLMSGDFNGDGIEDDVFVVRILPQSPEAVIATDIRIANPWQGRERPEPLDAVADALALVIVHGRGRGRFLLYGEFLNTPIWRERKLPIELARKGSASFRRFARQSKVIRHDILLLGTEAGIDVALYWNGVRYAVFWPREEP